MSSKIPYKKGKLFYHEFLNKQFVCALIPPKTETCHTHFGFFVFGQMLINPKTTHPHIYFFAFGQMLINPNIPTYTWFLFLADDHQPKPPTYAWFLFLADAHHPKNNCKKHRQTPANTNITSSRQAPYNKLWAKCQYVKLESYLCSLKIQYRDRKVRSN